MRLLEKKEMFRVDTENEALEAIKNFRDEAAAGRYTVKSASYVYKKKVQKKEIVDECYVVSLIGTYGPVWIEE